MRMLQKLYDNSTSKIYIYIDEYNYYKVLNPEYITLILF